MARMRLNGFDGRAACVALFWMFVGCEEPDPTPAAVSVAASPPAPSVEEAPPAPGPCKAAGEAPAELGKVVGDVHGFGQDATHLYYSSWSLYGGRGDVGRIQKDGGGMRALTSLQLEPRSLAVDRDTLYYTSGIRLMKVPKEGGEGTQVVEVFSSQDIAVDDSALYGVPGDYGPYDRVAKLDKKKREVEELFTGKRPKHDGAPNGFNRVVVQGESVIVTDAGNGRVFRLGRDGGAPKVLAQNQDRAFDLAVVGPTAYFSLAKKGLLMAVPVAGGKVKRVASGLVPDARIAAEGDAVFAVFAGKSDSEPQAVGQVDPESGVVEPLAKVPPLDPVVALAADTRCVYWAQRKSASETIVFARKR